MKQCPLCFGKLETRDCAPCDDCGWDVPKEIDHLNAKLHTYTIYEIYGGLRLTLCNSCAVDFGSHKPEYFGFKDNKRLDLFDFNLVKQIAQPAIVKDKFCPDCSARLTFLKFVSDIRQLNELQGLKAES